MDSELVIEKLLDSAVTNATKRKKYRILSKAIASAEGIQHAKLTYRALKLYGNFKFGESSYRAAYLAYLRALRLMPTCLHCAYFAQECRKELGYKQQGPSISPPAFHV